jgi:SAM-dependent methyltransferase
MRFFDRVLQNWRARMARSWVPAGATVLDIGCHQGEFLDSLGALIDSSVGLDPKASGTNGPRHRLLPVAFSAPLAFPDASFDAVVLLATLEHIRDKEPLGRECYRLLRPGGRVIITVPSPWVDVILTPLCRFRVADGMSLEEHDGYDPHTTPQYFVPHGFVLEYRRSFQLGLNHLFIFRKPATPCVPETEAASLPTLAGEVACA